MGACASHADEMKKGGVLINVPAERKSTIRKGYMYSSLHVSLTRPCLSTSLADTPCTISHDSDVLL